MSGRCYTTVLLFETSGAGGPFQRKDSGGDQDLEGHGNISLSTRSAAWTTTDRERECWASKSGFAGFDVGVEYLSDSSGNVGRERRRGQKMAMLNFDFAAAGKLGQQLDDGTYERKGSGLDERARFDVLLPDDQTFVMQVDGAESAVGPSRAILTDGP
ncbi:MAG: hypothetical protein R2724_21735 [Bryobacterales bacterium]